MIGYLSGLIADKDEKHLIVLTNGVGYKVFTPTDVLSSAKIDEKTHLHIHTAVREDEIALYGFKKKEELQFFNQLLSVSGIGPKMALEILSAPIHLTQNAILNSDTAMLTKIKGLGKKTAERMVVELKNKVVPARLDATKPANAFNEEVVLALTSLGYERYDVLRFVSNLPADLTDSEEIIRRFLKEA